MVRLPIFISLALFVLGGCIPQDKNAKELPPNPVIIDADTGNEMDDLYAIVRGLIAEDWPVIGLTSAHFNNIQLLTDSLWHIYPTEGIKTQEISQQLNEEILRGMDRENIPHPPGCDRMVGFAWGYYEGAPIPKSEGVDFIVAQARRASPDNKLNLVILGPVTNLAAALLKAPELASHIRAYMLGMRYDSKSGAWNKNEFNARNDLNALDLLLDNSELEVIVMPASTAEALTFDHNKSVQKLSAYTHPIADLLSRRWEEVNAGNNWTMWDLALIEALLHPEWATLQSVEAPPENGSRMIQAYTHIDAEAMEAEFWSHLNGALEME